MRKFCFNILFVGFFTLRLFQVSHFGVKVRPHDKELIETETKRVATVEFRVTNPSYERQEFEAEVDLPEGWILITEDFPFELDPDESIIKFVSFYVPKNILAGKYKVTYRVRGKKFRSIVDYFTIHVVILNFKKVEKPKQEIKIKK